jgi:ABC-type microcin C transport system permease subunit YejB
MDTVMRTSPIRFLISISARLLAVLVVTFLVVQLAPGGPIDHMLTRLHEWLIDDGNDRGPIR